MLTLIFIVNLLFQVYTLMLFARILLSWLPDLKEYLFFQYICLFTDPYLDFFRRFIPPLGMIDISPILAFLALGFIQNIVNNFLLRFI